MEQVLLVTPNFKYFGGVTEFNKMLIKYSGDSLKPFFLSGAGLKHSKIIKIILFLYDLIRFTLKITLSSYEIVHLNPSLGSNSILRDGLFCLIAKFVNKKVYIHWHGWNPNNEFLLEGASLRFMKATIFKADHIKFLSSDFAQFFIEKGYTNKISLGRTFVDNDLLDGFTPRDKGSKTVNILFLSTISKNKGIYMAIELFSELVNDFDITLTVAGNGHELENVKRLIPTELSGKIMFTGHVTGKNKKDVFKQADIYLFPSQYEGMPTSLLEAMGFGLPIICSSVGALPEIFEDGVMGYIVNKDDFSAFKNALKSLITNQMLRKAMGKYNHTFVLEKFLATKVIERINKDYLELVS